MEFPPVTHWVQVHIDDLEEGRVGVVLGQVEGNYSVAESEKERTEVSIEQIVYGIVPLEEAEWSFVEEA